MIREPRRARYPEAATAKRNWKIFPKRGDVLLWAHLGVEKERVSISPRESEKSGWRVFMIAKSSRLCCGVPFSQRALESPRSATPHKCSLSGDLVLATYNIRYSTTRVLCRHTLVMRLATNLGSASCPTLLPSSYWCCLEISLSAATWFKFVTTGNRKYMYSKTL